MEHTQFEDLLKKAEEESAELKKKNLHREIERKYDEIIAILLDECQTNSSPEKNRIISTVFNNRGLSRYHQVKFEEAIDDYNEAIKYDSASAFPYYNRGTVRYRLSSAYDKPERLATLDGALNDFDKALQLQPGNKEFEQGYLSCKDLYEDETDDGNFSSKKKKTTKHIINWNEIPRSKLLKLLFLLESGDKCTSGSALHESEKSDFVEKQITAFLFYLKKENISQVVDILEGRLYALCKYLYLEVPATSELALAEEQDLLTFVEACNLLEIDCSKLNTMKKKAQHNLCLDETECQGNYFILAENLRMSRICDRMSPGLVDKLYEMIRRHAFLKALLDTEVAISSKRLEMNGFKEALFFYIVRILEVNNMHNRIYTDTLEDLLSNLLINLAVSEGEEYVIRDILGTLSTYPIECRPTGYCVIFCVTCERQGADGEIKKVKQVFGNSLGYTISVEVNPTMETIQEYRRKLETHKYRFYDSLILWFMCHGSLKEIRLGDNQMYDKKDIINSFCKLKNFRKKPKVFFLASCQGDKPIPIENYGSVKATVDSGRKGTDATRYADSQFLNIPDQYRDRTAVYYEMDRLIAHATLPDKYAFRIEEGGRGSVFVDTVCRLLESSKGKNITQVLEKANNALHQILFSCKEKFEGLAKQACYYESTFQKTFNVPDGNPRKMS